MVLGFLTLVILFLLCLSLIVGLVLFIIGEAMKTDRYKLRKAGLILAGIPTAIIALIMIVNFFNEAFTTKPNNEDLVGTYQMVQVTGIDIGKENFKNYTLIFYEDKTFYLSPTPYIEVCENGKYHVNYTLDYNELSLDCPNLFTHAHIDRGWGNFTIEFNIGDPDGGQSIFFEKVSQTSHLQQ